MRCDLRRSESAIGSLWGERGGRFRLACTATGILLLISCARVASPQAQIRIDREIAPQPVRVGRASVTLRVTDLAARPVTGAHIGLEADMSHPGMSPVFGETKEIGPGIYRGQLEFGMAGDWVILLRVALPGGQKLERQIDVAGVQPN